MVPLEVWPASLPRIKFVYLMDFSPPRKPVVHSMQFKLYVPIVDALWHRIWLPVRNACGCDYHPKTRRPDYFFDGEDQSVHGAVDWNVEPSIYDYDNMDWQ